jgi:hypothetical protein
MRRLSISNEEIPKENLKRIPKAIDISNNQ